MNDDATALVTTKIGDILENSIRVNELLPRDDTSGTYVLLGIAEDKNKNYYPVRVVVNKYSTVEEVEVLDVLYAVNAKKKDQSSMRQGFVEDKAYQLSKDLLGAYDEVGMMGQTLRRYWVPFYSFTETNLKRYYRLFENIIVSDASIPKKAGKLLLKGLMVNLLPLLMLAWNKLVMDEEDEKLPPSTRNVPHVILTSTLKRRHRKRN